MKVTDALWAIAVAWWLICAVFQVIYAVARYRRARIFGCTRMEALSDACRHIAGVT